MNFSIKPWNCPSCTYLNEVSYYQCGICGHQLEKYSFDIPKNLIEKKDNYLKKCKMDKFTKTFEKRHVLLPVIHCLNKEQTMKNCDLCFSNNIDGVWLIGHDINHQELYDILKYVRTKYHTQWIGVNFLDRYPFQIFQDLKKNKLKIDGIWCDNAGIHDSNNNMVELNLYCRLDSNWDGLYFGGVAFKFQNQPKDLKSVTQIASKYLDVITTSGKGDGNKMCVEKAKIMSMNSNSTPLAIASGIDLINCEEYRNYNNCYMVSTSIQKDFYNFDGNKLKALRDKINLLNS